ncbi:MAG TPA: chlorite dismutase, partial [Candidatus Limnocylindria bacterium]|nr:chlorite dismutase [Candidatus Limnocylindria bacterium]
MGPERFVHAWLLKLDPAWRRLPSTERRDDLDAFCAAMDRVRDRVVQHEYSTLGLRAEGDLLLWR